MKLWALAAFAPPLLTAAFFSRPAHHVKLSGLRRVQGKGASVRMSLSTVDITLTTAILETLPDSLGQIVDGANTAAQALLDGVVNGQPVVPPEQLQQAFESVGATLPAITDSFKELANGATGLVDSLKQGVPQVSLPDLGGGELGENVEQAQAQLGQFFSSKLSEVGGALSGQTEKALEEAGKALGPALDPAKPYLEQLNSQLSVVKDLTQKVSQEVIKDQGVIVERASPIVQGLSKYGTPRNLFNAENLAVLPLWASIILAPNNRLVKGFMKSYIPIVLAAFVYVWLTYLAFNDPVSLEGFSGMSDLSVLTKGFSSETSVAVAWAHFICQDLFVGRYIYLDGQRNNVWTGHSLTLAFLFGPAGIISHLLTRGLVRVFRWDVKDILEAGSSNLVASAAEKEASVSLKEAEKALRKAESQAVKTTARAKREADGTLSKAQEQAERLLKRAEAEAAQMMNQAREEAEATVNGARDEARRIVARQREGRPSSPPPPRAPAAAPKEATDAAPELGAQPRGGATE